MCKIYKKINVKNLVSLNIIICFIFLLQYLLVLKFSTTVKTKKKEKLFDRMSKKTEIVLLEITIRPQDPNWVSRLWSTIFTLRNYFYFSTHINIF